MNISEKTILLVDDDASLRRVLAHHLAEAGYRVLTAADGKAGLDTFTAEQVDLVITDIQMPEMSGLELLRRTSVMSPDTIVLVITAYGSIETAVEAMKFGAHDYITKPFNREELLLTVAKALEYTALMRENRSLRQFNESRFSLDNIIGTSTAMQRVFNLVEKVARTDLAVLITGESGTGKELIAKAIHQHGARRDGPFREDLYFRLKVVPIHLPPLRERREDIPLLADHFLKEAAQRYGRPELRFDKDVFRYFQSYAWPGNVRELKHTIERLAVIAENDALSIGDLPDNLTAATSAAANVLINLPDDDIDLEEVEREILRQALDKHGWNQTRTAQYINITRGALIYRMQKYGLQTAETSEKGRAENGGA